MMEGQEGIKACSAFQSRPAFFTRLRMATKTLHILSKTIKTVQKRSKTYKNLQKRSKIYKYLQIFTKIYKCYHEGTKALSCFKDNYLQHFLATDCTEKY
jgi:hypothetical protein